MPDAIRRGQKSSSQCAVCHKLGATVNCCNTKECNRNLKECCTNRYHFSCAWESGVRFMLDSTTFCNPTRPDHQGPTEYTQSMRTLRSWPLFYAARSADVCASRVCAFAMGFAALDFIDRVARRVFVGQKGDIRTPHTHTNLFAIRFFFADAAMLHGLIQA